MGDCPKGRTRKGTALATNSERPRKIPEFVLGRIRRALAQDPRRRSIEKMELAMVIETKATMANPRMTTITGNPLTRTQEGRAGGLPNTIFVFSMRYIYGI
jgi:hypothetical protein